MRYLPILAAGVLLFPLWPFARLLASSSARRSFPDIVTGIAAALAAYVTVVAAAAWLLPGWMPMAALAVMGGTAVCAWICRPGYGRRGGLPPGTLSLSSFRTLTDPEHLAAQAARFGDVFKVGPCLKRHGMGGPRQPTVCIASLPKGRALLAAHEDAIAPVPAAFNHLIPRGLLRYMTPSDHRAYRAVFTAAITPELVRRAESFIVAGMRGGLGELARQCTDAGDAGVYAFPQLERTVFPIWVEFFLGMPRGDARGEAVARAFGVLNMDLEPRTSDGEVLAALDTITALCRERPPSEDSVLGALLRARPSSLDDATIARNLIYILRNSMSDVAGLLHWILKLLCDHPEWGSRVRLDGALAEGVALETLRLQQSEFIAREARQEIRFAGFVIPKGWAIRVCVREAHRDPRVFAEPERFDPARFLGGRPAPAGFAPFGMGRHACLGTELTIAAARAFVRELAGGFDWEVVSDGPVEVGRFHWRPSSRFRVVLRARTVERA